MWNKRFVHTNIPAAAIATSTVQLCWPMICVNFIIGLREILWKLIKLYFGGVLWWCFWKRLAFRSLFWVEVILTNVSEHHLTQWGISQNKQTKVQEQDCCIWSGILPFGFDILNKDFMLIMFERMTCSTPLRKDYFIMSKTIIHASCEQLESHEQHLNSLIFMIHKWKQINCQVQASPCTLIIIAWVGYSL